MMPKHGLDRVTHPHPNTPRYHCICGEMTLLAEKMRDHLEDEGVLKENEEMRHWRLMKGEK